MLFSISRHIKCYHYLILWCFSYSIKCQEKMFYIREKIDQLLKNLYVIELIFQLFNLDRTPTNLWVQDHYRIKTPEPLKIESKLKHFKRNKVNVVLVSGGDGKILENIWGNTTGKRHKGTLRLHFTCLEFPRLSGGKSW